MPFCKCGELCLDDKCSKCGFDFKGTWLSAVWMETQAKMFRMSWQQQQQQQQQMERMARWIDGSQGKPIQQSMDSVQ